MRRSAISRSRVGDRLLLSGNRARPRPLRGGDRHRAFGGFVGDRDRAFNRCDLDLAVALQLEAADIAIARHPRFGQAALSRNARPFDLLARADLGLLEGLALGDVERVELPLAFEPRGIKRPLLRDASGLDVLRRGDLGAALIGLCLRQFRRFHGDGDLAGDLGHFEGATALHLDFAALTVALDTRLLERELKRDLLALGLLARTDLGLFDRRRRTISRCSISSWFWIRASARLRS